MELKLDAEKYYFISDLHFGFYSYELEKDRIRLFENLCQEISKSNSVLFIVGDLFDFWFDYKTVVPKNTHRIIKSLEDLIFNGNRIIYLMGNHDFYHSGYLGKELKIEIFDRPLIVNLGSHKFYLDHGDGLNKKDYGYLILKKILRNNILQFLFSLIHPSLSISVAQYFSQKSREYTSLKDEKDYSYIYKHAETLVSDGIEFVVMGHTHQREIIKIKNGTYINLGTWLTKPCVGIYDNNNFQIKELVE